MSFVFYSYNKQKIKYVQQSTPFCLLTLPQMYNPNLPSPSQFSIPLPRPQFTKVSRSFANFAKNPRRCLLSFIAITNKKKKLKYVQQSTPFCLLPIPKLSSTNLPSPSQFSIPLPAPILPTFAEALQILQKP